MNLDQFKPLTVYTIYIASTPEKVWEALTSAEFSRKYFSGFAVEMEQRLGGTFIVRAPDGSEHITGEVFEYEPPNKLTVTWNINWPDLVAKLGTTLVTYEIEPAGEAVRLTMSEGHDRPLSDDILSGGRTGSNLLTMCCRNNSEPSFTRGSPAPKRPLAPSLSCCF